MTAAVDQHEALVDIVIAAHDAGATLEETLLSIEAQTFHGWRAIIVDDASSDDTAAIAGRFAARDGRFKLVHTEVGGTAGRARNAGLLHAAADWILFLDADDLLDPPMIETMLASARESGADAVHCGWRSVNEEGLPIFEGRCQAEGNLFSLLAIRPLCAIHACLFKRGLLETAGTFDRHLKTNEDTDLWQRIARTGARFAAVPQTLVTYRYRVGQSWFDPERYVRDALLVLERAHASDDRLPLGQQRADPGGFVAAAYHLLTYAAVLAQARSLPWKPLTAVVAEAILAFGHSPAATLDPMDCAESAFEAYHLALRQPPEAWANGFDQAIGGISELLQAIEELSGSPGLARSSLRMLERKAAGLLEGEGRLGATIVRSIDVAEDIAAIHDAEASHALLRIHYGSAFLGILDLPVYDGIIPALLIRDAISDLYAWPILGFALTGPVQPELGWSGENHAVSFQDHHIGFAAENPRDAELPTIHDSFGWAIFLIELWGSQGADQNRLYAPLTYPEPSEAPSDPLILDIVLPAAQPDIAADWIEVRLGRARLGYARRPMSDEGDPLAAITAAVTQQFGFELCRLVVREAYIGRSGMRGKSIRKQPNVAGPSAEWEGMTVGRWPQQGPESWPRVATLPSLSAPAVLAARASGSSKARLVPLLFDPSVGDFLEGVVDHPRPAEDGIPYSTRHHFEALFAKGENPWSYTSPYEQTKYVQTLELATRHRARRALELACAEGHFTCQLAPRVGRLVAADISEIALERARERCAGLGNVEFRRLDLLNDALDGSFDLITCCEVLYYLPDKASLALIAEKFAAALNRGGSIVLAHAHVLVDDPHAAGFDWEVPFGALTIADVFSQVPQLVLEEEYVTPLYRIQLYRRPQFSAFGRNRKALSREVPFQMPEPAVAARIRWDGGEVQPGIAAPDVTSRLPILMYHSIGDRETQALSRYRTSTSAFEAQLRYLRDAGFRSASFAEWRRARRMRQPLPGKRVLISFDDGYRDFAESAWPLLRQYGFDATLFVVSGLVGGRAEWDERYGAVNRLLDWSELRSLAAEGLEIGSHSATHRPLTSLDPEDVVKELLFSRSEISNHIGKQVSVLSYPYGLFDPETVRLAWACGYTDGVSVRAGCSPMQDDTMALRRIEIPGGIDIPEFIRLLES